MLCPQNVSEILFDIRWDISVVHVMLYFTWLQAHLVPFRQVSTLLLDENRQYLVPCCNMLYSKSKMTIVVSEIVLGLSAFPIILNMFWIKNFVFLSCRISCAILHEYLLLGILDQIFQ